MVYGNSDKSSEENSDSFVNKSTSPENEEDGISRENNEQSHHKAYNDSKNMSYNQNQDGIQENRLGFGGTLKDLDWSQVERKKVQKDYHKINKEKLSKSEIKEFRKALNITINDDNAPAPIHSFELAKFPQFVNNIFEKCGYRKPTPIQAQGWPIVLSGRNIIGVAETGSGKTLAFIIPAILHAMAQPRNNSEYPNVVIISPTRELSNQIQGECIKFSTKTDLRSVCCYGGTGRRNQISNLRRGVDIVIGTPGRIIDFLENKFLSFRNTSMFIVDEADRMLDMGFEPQLRRINSQIPPERQTLFWTATWPNEVKNLAKDFVKNPIQVNIGSLDPFAVHSIRQHVEIVDNRDKFEVLTKKILPEQLNQNGKVLIFVETKKTAEYLYERFVSANIKATVIHGDKIQMERENVLNAFKHGSSNVMIATDIAQRGLDVPNITCVVNYNFPKQIEDYVHRIGRTGRAGKSGIAYTFFTRDDSAMSNSLIKVLEEANQNIPDQLREMVGGGEVYISRRYPKPWDERDDVEKGSYINPVYSSNRERVPRNQANNYEQNDFENYGQSYNRRNNNSRQNYDNGIEEKKRNYCVNDYNSPRSERNQNYNQNNNLYEERPIKRYNESEEQNDLVLNQHEELEKLRNEVKSLQEQLSPQNNREENYRRMEYNKPYEYLKPQNSSSRQYRNDYSRY